MEVQLQLGLLWAAACVYGRKRRAATAGLHQHHPSAFAPKSSAPQIPHESVSVQHRPPNFLQQFNVDSDRDNSVDRWASAHVHSQVTQSSAIGKETQPSSVGPDTSAIALTNYRKETSRSSAKAVASLNTRPETSSHFHTTQLKITQDGVLAMCSSLRAHVGRCVCDVRAPEVAGRRCQGMRQEPKTTTTWITVKSCMSQLQVTPSMT